jgi:hypothetical protein
LDRRPKNNDKVFYSQRLFGTLESSNFALSSDEAKQVLDRLDIDDTVTIVDRAMLENTTEKEIQSLEEAEMRFSEKLQQYEETDRETFGETESGRNWGKKGHGTRTTIGGGGQGTLGHDFHCTPRCGATSRVRKNAFWMDRVTSSLSKKQEKVRSVLKKKADMMNGGIQVEYLTEEDLTSLRRQEIKLMGESKQVTTMVTRLQSRAEKLQTRLVRKP